MLSKSVDIHLVSPLSTTIDQDEQLLVLHQQSAEKTDSSQQGLEFLFSPLLEEYYNPTHGQAEENNNNQAPNASFQEDEFINPFCTPVMITDGQDQAIRTNLWKSNHASSNQTTGFVADPQNWMNSFKFDSDYTSGNSSTKHLEQDGRGNDFEESFAPVAHKKRLYVAQSPKGFRYPDQPEKDNLLMDKLCDGIKASSTSWTQYPTILGFVTKQLISDAEHGRSLITRKSRLQRRYIPCDHLKLECQDNKTALHSTLAEAEYVDLPASFAQVIILGADFNPHNAKCKKALNLLKKDSDIKGKQRTTSKRRVSRRTTDYLQYKMTKSNNDVKVRNSVPHDPVRTGGSPTGIYPLVSVEVP
ncbi:hypothetical protein Tco_1336333 [Tanacetum coccineum]